MKIWFFIAVVLFFLLFSILSPHLECSNARDGGNSIALRMTERKAILFAPVIGDYLIAGGDVGNIYQVAKYINDESAVTLRGRFFPLISNIKEADTIGGAYPVSAEQLLLEDEKVVFIWPWFSSDIERLCAIDVFKVSLETDMFRPQLYLSLAAFLKKPEVIGIYRNIASKSIVNRDKRKTRVMVVGGSSSSMWWGHGGLKGYFDMIEGVDTMANMSYGVGLNTEELIYFDPSVIFLSDYYSDNLTPQYIYNNSTFNAISAIRNKKVYTLPSTLARLGGAVEAPLILSWLARLIHPEIYNGSSIRDEISAAYKSILGHAINDEDIDFFLRMEENASSANYDQFKAPVSH